MSTDKGKGKTMSDEYIEKEDAIQSIIAHDLVGGDARGWAEYLLENTSSVDVAPIKHGRWDADMGGVWCSVCGEYSEGEWDYCPYCGARMDGEINE